MSDMRQSWVWMPAGLGLSGVAGHFGQTDPLAVMGCLPVSGPLGALGALCRWGALMYRLAVILA